MLSQDKPNPKDSPQKSCETHRQNLLPTAPLPESISKNIETIIALHKRSEKDVPQHQRVVETVTDFFGRPAFLYSILLGIILWVTPNVLPRRLGIPRFDPVPFPWLQFSLTAGSLLVTAGVLVKQERQEKLAEQRTQLILQLNLLSEQKIAKLIALVEELRQDIPNVKNRSDPEAEMMKSPTDPHAIIDVLEETLASELASFSQQKTSIEE
ncbi:MULTISPECIES: DUF1003 domain-containing protein [unclassified Nostoc]|uniref:DUF1003 domain-containing protein n=1 Tax=unclassified Nostoc TaxID=2593658 RepID=UPI002AD37E5E|nr:MULTISPECIES: DUF1003 domain-containing protein [unclassified Nostoc]MDZ8122546.1 DUF1003 domain-containing protein [Nostoc sp. CmiVER01]MDZ8227363.1 DUF1003 domain-containing protein [Nostoc sp. ChiVER01]